MGQPPDVLHRHDEVAGRLEQLHRLVVGDAEEAPAVHLQDLVSYLQSEDEVSLAGPGDFPVGNIMPSPTREELINLTHHQARDTATGGTKKYEGEGPSAGGWRPSTQANSQ